LGPGILESAYEACLQFELKQREIQVNSQVALPIMYYGQRVDAGYRIDLLVENSLIIELKAVEKISNIHKAQLLSYLKLSDFRLGLLINFNVPRLKEGIHRIVNKF
jgi:GxxExxY protein